VSSYKELPRTGQQKQWLVAQLLLSHVRISKLVNLLWSVIGPDFRLCQLLRPCHCATRSSGCTWRMLRDTQKNTHRETAFRVNANCCGPLTLFWRLACPKQLSLNASLHTPMQMTAIWWHGKNVSMLLPNSCCVEQRSCHDQFSTGSRESHRMATGAAVVITITNILTTHIMCTFKTLTTGTSMCMMCIRWHQSDAPCQEEH